MASLGFSWFVCFFPLKQRCCFWGQTFCGDVEPQLHGEGMGQRQSALELSSNRPDAGEEEPAASHWLGIPGDGDGPRPSTVSCSLERICFPSH